LRKNIQKIGTKTRTQKFLKNKKRKISNKFFEQTCEIIIHKNENKKIFGKS
jgi:phosphoribosyl-ATP pyrophosphohydrolase